MKRFLLSFLLMLSLPFALLAQSAKGTDIILNSIIGYDGKPITSGYVYGLDISKGLPLKLVEGNSSSEVGLDFTLPGYESFWYKWHYGDSSEINLDLRQVVRPAQFKVLDHDGAAMEGAELVSKSGNNPRMTLAQTNAEGVADFYLVDVNDRFNSVTVSVQPSAKYHSYFDVPSIKYGKVYYASNTTVDYSKMHLFLMRVKKFNTDLRKRMFTDELSTSYNVSFETVVGGQATTSFRRSAYVDEGEDRVYYSMVEDDESHPVTKAWYRFAFTGKKEVYTASSFAFYREYDKLEGDYSFELDPTTWRPVRINVKDDLGTPLVPRLVWVDKVYPIDYNYKDPVVCLPQGEHDIDIYAATEDYSVVYENDGIKSLRKVVVTDATNVQDYNHEYKHGEYAGYEVTAVDGDGNPATGAYFGLSWVNGGRVVGMATLDSTGRGTIYHQYPGECEGIIRGIRNTAALTWTDNSPIGFQRHHIDVNNGYRKVRVTVKQHQKMYENKYDAPELHLYRTVDKLAAMPEFYDDSYIPCNWEAKNDTSLVYTANLYMQDGWLCGYLIQRDLRDSIAMMEVPDNGELNFDYTKYAYVKYMLDGKQLPAGYNNGGLMAASVGHAPEAEWNKAYAPEFLLPGNYYACVVSSNYADELPYIVANVPSFKVECATDNSEVEVPLTTLPDDDYVQVPLKLDGIFFLSGAKAKVDVKFLYNGQLPLVVGGDNYATVNTEVPLRVLKGDYNYSVDELTFDEKHHYVVGHDRKLTVDTDTKALKLDLSGLHYFNTIKYFDAEGNEIDWLDLWTPLNYAHFYNGQKFLAECYVSSYQDDGLLIPAGDYDIKLYVGDFIGNSVEHDATLHVDDQSGTTARIVLGQAFTPVEQVVVENRSSELTIRYVNGYPVVVAPVAAPVRVAVYALNGVCMNSINVVPWQRIDLGDLSKGAYIVRLSQGSVSNTVKIAK